MVKTKYILIALAVIALLLFAWYLSRKKSLSFDFNLGGNITDLLGAVEGRYSDPTAKGVGLYVEVPLTTIITNKGAAATVLNNLMGSISYNGEAIMQTRADSNVLQSVTVPGKTSAPVTDSVQLLINPSSINFLTQLVQGKKPAIKYNFGSTILGKAYSFSNTSKIGTPGNPSGQRIAEDLFDAAGNPVGSSNAKQKACCVSCLEYSHTLSIAAGNLPAGTKVYRCNKACSCGTFN